MILKGDLLVVTHVVGHKHGLDGNPVGQANTNPILDLHVYEVLYDDGYIEVFTSNIIAENIYNQVDADGYQYLFLKEISDHCKDETAVKITDKWIQHGANQTLCHSTQG